MNSGRILICDDDAIARLIVHHILSVEGIFIIAMHDRAGSLLSDFEKNGADLVILDALMPEMNGTELLSKMRGLPGGSQTPAVFITATDDFREIENLYSCGGAAVLQKPFDLASLPRIARELINKSKMQTNRS